MVHDFTKDVFKNYDIRGKYPGQLNDGFAFHLASILAEQFRPRKVVIGKDARLSSDSLLSALANGLLSKDASVDSLGLCGTEEIYHAVATSSYDLGIMITGSHNPADENGFKIIKRGAIPLQPDELEQVAARFMAWDETEKTVPASKNIAASYNRGNYLDHLLKISGISKNKFRPLKVLVDAGNGCAGMVLTELAHRLPFEIIPFNFEPDGNFPNGVPNPLLPDKRFITSRAVLKNKADIGVAFDGDFDRCFFYDNKGNFLDGYYIVGFLAAALLKSHPGTKIVHDPRLYWNTVDIVHKEGGIPVMSKTGHSFMKEAMRNENAVYGGEMSSHHYFKDFHYCDSGILTMLMVISQVMSGKYDLEYMVNLRKKVFPISGEINFLAENKDEIIDNLWKTYSKDSIYTDKLDGINLEFKEWRFNLRKSNTESILRLNVESRGNAELMIDKQNEISETINKLKTF